MRSIADRVNQGVAGIRGPHGSQCGFRRFSFPKLGRRVPRPTRPDIGEISKYDKVQATFHAKDRPVDAPTRETDRRRLCGRKERA